MRKGGREFGSREWKHGRELSERHGARGVLQKHFRADRHLINVCIDFLPDMVVQ